MSDAPPSKRPVEADVVVIGGGLAGHCAALEAVDRGASVLLLEKRASYGGSSILSSGSFAFAGTSDQAEVGVDDSESKLSADLMKASGDHADPTLIELYVRRQCEDFLWLKSQGVQFHKIALSSNQTVPRTHPTDPVQAMGALHRRVASHPQITYWDNCPVTQLLHDRRGHISGVKVFCGRGAVALKARSGVVIASGGFSRSPTLVAKFVPRLATALALGGEGNVGDGLLMAWKLGADMLDMGQINGTFGVSLKHYPDTRVEPGDNPLLRLGIYKGAIAVNRLGHRFANESISYKVLGEMCLSQPGSIGFQVWDEKIMEQSRSTPNSNDLRGAFELGLVRRADSVRGLAEAVGMDANTLSNTVTRYNTGAERGEEEDFGRSSLGKGFGRIAPIDQPPFYIYPCTTAILATYCGVRVDLNMRVIDVCGNAIRGLFAAGEVIGGFHGSGYMSGSSLSKAAIFGRVAGASATGESRRARS